MANVDQGWVLFDLKSRQFGLPIRNLLQMVVLKDVVKMAGAPPDVRGVINLRGAVIPVVDLRMRLGLTGMCEEWNRVFAMMEERKQDHVRWISALEESVADGREFTSARDPHQCAFGKWYDSFKTDNNILSLHLEKFDAPHKKIHALADKVSALMTEGRAGEAAALILTTRNKELAELIHLFDETREVVCDTVNEIVMVMQQHGAKMGVIVDSVSEVKDIDPDSVENPLDGESIAHSSFIKGVAQMEDGTKILLDQDLLLGA